MKRVVLGVLLVVAAALAWSAAPAAAYVGLEHLHFAAGPYAIKPGANQILTDADHIPKPTQAGYMVRMAPNLRYALPNGKCCGAVPRVDVIHLHHGVWLSDDAAGQGEGNSYGTHLYPFMASGEEKTIYEFPTGYGYPISPTDLWILNYMIHNLTSHATKVYVTYSIDFVPSTSVSAAKITPLHPIWMDVEAHHIYPVFNVLRGSGIDGKFTFPDMAKDPYGGGTPLNEFTVDHPGTLVGTAGHVHPGGLYDDLDLIRAGASRRPGAAPAGTVPNSVRLFRSNAHYFDKRGPISWDMAMTATAPDWRPQLQAGDTLRISATYETRRASWYESMGIMVAWEAWDTKGIDPFTHPLDETGHVTHGHLPENNHHGGAIAMSMPMSVNPSTFPNCFTHTVRIASFSYVPGDLSARPANRCAPSIREGQSLTFTNDDASPLSPGIPGLAPSPAYLAAIFHTVTACQSPCNRTTGIDYPLANGAGGFDSGQLGVGTPAVGRLSWSTPTSLRPGTYTFFCRIHPFMRGVFRIVQ